MNDVSITKHCDLPVQHEVAIHSHFEKQPTKAAIKKIEIDGIFYTCVATNPHLNRLEVAVSISKIKKDDKPADTNQPPATLQDAVKAGTIIKINNTWYQTPAGQKLKGKTAALAYLAWLGVNVRQ
jgi:hypothetical protein